MYKRLIIAVILAEKGTDLFFIDQDGDSGKRGIMGRSVQI